MKRFLLAFTSILAFGLIGGTAYASPGLNFIDGFTKVNASLSGGYLTTYTNQILATDSVEYSPIDLEVYTLTNSTRDLKIYDLFGTVKATVNIMDSASPALHNVKLKYSKSGKQLFIIGISGNGNYTFPSNPANNQTGLNNTIMIIKIDTLTRKVSEVATFNSGVNNVISDDIQETPDGGFFISGAFDDLSGSSTGFNIYVLSDGTISKAAVYPQATIVTSTTQLDSTHTFIAGKKTTGEGFVTELDSTYLGIGTMPASNNVTVNWVYYNSLQNKNYIGLTYSGSQTFNGVALPNNGTMSSVILQTAVDFSGGGTVINFANGAGNVVIDKVRLVDGSDILIYGKYTGTIGSLGNQGGYDGIIYRLTPSGTTYVVDSNIVLNTSTDDYVNNISAATSGVDYYFATMGDGTVIKIGNDKAVKVNGCYTTKEVYLDYDYSLNKYLTCGNDCVQSYGDTMGDGNPLDGDFQVKTPDEIYNIMNENFSFNGKNYVSGLRKRDTDFGDKASINQTIVSNNLAEFKDIMIKNISLNETKVNKTTNSSIYKKFGITPDLIINGYNNYTIGFGNLVPAASNDALFLGKWIYYRANPTSSILYGGDRASEFETYDGISGGRDLARYLLTPFSMNRLNLAYYPTNPGNNFVGFPILKNGVPTGDYIEYNCGNLICTNKSCSNLSAELATTDATKAVCGNGSLEGGEQCDGTEFTPQFTKDFPAYNYKWNCSPTTCMASASKLTPTTVTLKRLITFYDKTKCAPPADLFCGDGVYNTLAQKTATVGKTNDGLQEQCDTDDFPPGTPDGSTCSKTCTIVLPPSGTGSEICGDGTIQSFDKKQTDKLITPSLYIDDKDEDCDNGAANGTVGNTCSKVCKSIAIPATPLSCGDSIIQSAKDKQLVFGSTDLINEECDNGTVNNDGVTPLNGKICTADCKVPTTGVNVCGNGIVEAGNNESCEYPNIGFNSATETCNSCHKYPIQDATGSVCGDGQITGGESGDEGTAPIANWMNKGVGYPTVIDSTSPFGATKPSSYACMRSACGNGTLEVWGGEECDNGLTTGGNPDGNGSGIEKNNVTCNNSCKIEKKNLCGNGTRDIKEYKIPWLDIYGETQFNTSSYIEECDNGTTNNDGTTSINGVACTAQCTVAPICGADASTTQLSAHKYFLQFNSVTNPSTSTYRLVYWDGTQNKFKDYGTKVKLPDSSTDLQYVPGSKVDSKLTYEELQNLSVAKTKILNGMNGLITSSALRRNWGGVYKINLRLQPVTDTANSLDSLSWSYGELQGVSTRFNTMLSKFYFGMLMEKVEGQKLEVETTDCSGNYNQIGTANIVGVIDADTDSVFVLKSLGSVIPADVYSGNY